MFDVQRTEYAGPARLRAMQRLSSRLCPETSWRHAGDLAWAATCAGDPAQGPTALWCDGGEVVAWGWLEGPGELTLQVDARRPELAGEVLAWAEGAGPEPVGTTISGNEPHIAAALAARGYRTPAPADGPFFSCLGHDLTNLPPVPALPAGYTVRQCDAAQVADRAAAHRAAWSAWGSSYSEYQHAAMRGLWPYKPEFDLLAVAADGTPAAYYQGWYDEESRVGHFEPVGTHPEHLRRGLSRALGTELLHRFAAAGARLVTVTPRGDDAYPVARLTYASLGFTAFSRTYAYTQAVAHAGVQVAAAAGAASN